MGLAMSIASPAAFVLAGILAVAIPLTGPFERRIYQSAPSTWLKLATYGVNVMALWALTATAAWIVGWGELFASPEKGTSWLWGAPVSTFVAALAVAVYAAVGLMPLIQSLRGPRWRRAYAAAYRRSLADIPGFLPTTALERAAWAPLSLTAGFCEEVLCRGFLIRFLHGPGIGMPVIGALVAAAIIFRFAHLYQCAKGVAGTAIAGLCFGLLFLLSGSLIPGIILHVLVDLQVPFVLHPTPEDAPYRPRPDR